MDRQAAMAAHPEFPFLDPADPAGVERFLRARGWLAADEQLQAVAPAGAGNMNLTLRVTSDRREVVLKQARPWVEKYPHIAAPWERAEIERRFYERVAGIPGVAAQMPRLLAADAAAAALLLEYCPAARDLSSLYGGDRLTAHEVAVLAQYLAALHQATRGPADPALANRSMRELNHEHIFCLPLAEANGLDLNPIEPGLERAAAQLRGDARYRRLVAEAADRYLDTGDVLLHGDYFPGSWLRTAGGLRVIDPEFGFFGSAEWDLGTTLAHLALAHQSRTAAEDFLKAYRGALAPAGVGQAPQPAAEWIGRFAGIEVMRRLIGVAQLPLGGPAGFRAALLGRSRAAVLDGNWEALWAEE